MVYEEIVAFLLCVLPQVLATSCMSKCGIPSDWLPVASNVCYGTKGNNFGKFTMNRNCELYAIRFVHVSGRLSGWSIFRHFDIKPWYITVGITRCGNKDDPKRFYGFKSWDNKDISHRSRWGYKTNAPTLICTLLLKNRNRLIPREVDNESRNYYSLDGFKINDDVIVLKQNETLSTGQEFEIAFCLDFKDLNEANNEGTHCVDVDVSCYV